MHLLDPLYINLSENTDQGSAAVTVWLHLAVINGRDFTENFSYVCQFNVLISPIGHAWNNCKGLNG